MTQKRDSQGRFKADHPTRNRTLGIAAAAGALLGVVGAALHFGRGDRDAAKPAADDGNDTTEPQPDGSPEAPYDFRPASLTGGAKDAGAGASSLH